jgi:hypothetical protein
MSSWDEAIVVTIEYWHKQAEEARVLAEQLSDELAKAMMLRVAEDCDTLADMWGGGWGGDELRKPTSLSMRMSKLERLVARRPEGIFVNPFEYGEIGLDLFRAAWRMGLEGLVSKQLRRLSLQPLDRDQRRSLARRRPAIRH